jgi:hypothetical protein
MPIYAHLVLISRFLSEALGIEPLDRRLNEEEDLQTRYGTCAIENPTKVLSKTIQIERLR